MYNEMCHKCFSPIPLEHKGRCRPCYNKYMRAYKKETDQLPHVIEQKQRAYARSQANPKVKARAKLLRSLTPKAKAKLFIREQKAKLLEPVKTGELCDECFINYRMRNKIWCVDCFKKKQILFALERMYKEIKTKA